MLSRWVLTLHCRFSSFSLASFDRGGDSGGIGGVNCVYSTCLACCSFAVSAKSLSEE